ncbi:Nn.00g076890.m01.CDS01 [Neocucurbitaria sp. VM-36]
MSSSSSSKSNLTALLQGASTAGDARLVRCPTETLERLRHLHEAEVITLFTPFVPHPPNTNLAKDMDPFEPLGRALPRQVRHVPFRLDNGMTEMHTDFLPTSGAVVIVICVTSNVISYNKQAFEQQLRFARDISRRIAENVSIADLPVIMLLVDNDATGQAYAAAMPDFPALVTINDYTTAALANAVRVLFGK